MLLKKKKNREHQPKHFSVNTPLDQKDKFLKNIYNQSLLLNGASEKERKNACYTYKTEQHSLFCALHKRDTFRTMSAVQRKLMSISNQISPQATKLPWLLGNKETDGMQNNNRLFCIHTGFMSMSIRIQAITKCPRKHQRKKKHTHGFSIHAFYYGGTLNIRFFLTCITIKQEA